MTLRHKEKALETARDYDAIIRDYCTRKEKALKTAAKIREKRSMKRLPRHLSYRDYEESASNEVSRIEPAIDTSYDRVENVYNNLVYPWNMNAHMTTPTGGFNLYRQKVYPRPNPY